MLNDEIAIGNMPYQMAPMKSDNSQSLIFQAMFKQLIDFISKEVQITKTANGIDKLGATNDKLNSLLLSLNEIANKLDTNKITSDVSGQVASIIRGLDGVASSMDTLAHKEVRLSPADIKALKPIINIPEVIIPEPLKSIEISNLKVLKDGLDAIRVQLKQLVALELNDEDASKSDKYNQQVIELLGNLKLLSDSADSPISVRLSDGDKFYKAVDKLSDKIGIVGGGGSGGVVSQRLGATVTNSFATVGASSGTVIAAHAGRITVTITNDSDATVYLAKGPTAVSGSGIRLNASGGAIIIDDYAGIITGISSGASKNVCICQVTP